MIFGVSMESKKKMSFMRSPWFFTLLRCAHTITKCVAHKTRQAFDGKHTWFEEFPTGHRRCKWGFWSEEIEGRAKAGEKLPTRPALRCAFGFPRWGQRQERLGETDDLATLRQG